MGVFSKPAKANTTGVSGAHGIDWRFVALKSAAILVVLLFTNPDVLGRIKLLWVNSRYETLLPYVAIWGVSVVAIFVAVFQPEAIWRWIWAVVFALSTAVAWGYKQASLSELNAFDIISLWNARHEAGRASEQYFPHVMMGSVLFVAVLVLMAVGSAEWGPAVRRWMRRFVWLPFVPVVMIGAIVFMKSGGGSQAMPSQFSPLALGGVTGARIALKPPVGRSDVTLPLQQQGRQDKLVVIVDESVRADYINMQPGNQLTPELAKVSGKLIDYGRAVSGGNCSHYSNAILRFLVNRNAVVKSANTNPTIWDYAHKAGYRTVFIDGQAGAIRDGNALQNFMTMAERGKIDTFHALQNVEAHQADEELARIVALELATPGPVFIYANKNGAHFPYDHSYPQSEAVFHPTVTEAQAETLITRAASYMNAIRWSVDRILPRLVGEVEKNGATMIYTSDHGQIVEPVGLTHCQVENPDSRTALVPIMLQTSDEKLEKKLRDMQRGLHDRTNHFMLPPTILKLMGFDNAAVEGLYSEDLFRSSKERAAFTTGDIFGLFSDEVRWNEINVEKDVLEPAARQLTVDRSASVKVQELSQ